MAFKPNYQQQRGDRARAKDQKRQERIQRREAQSARRKESQTGQLPEGGTTTDIDDPSPTIGSAGKSD
jgi:hypothetical protein